VVSSPDIEITVDVVSLLAQAEGLTEAGVEFLDAYTVLNLEVVDSGRIIVPEVGLFALRMRAAEAGLTVGG
jgi:hypothetical protein